MLLYESKLIQQEGIINGEFPIVLVSVACTEMACGHVHLDTDWAIVAVNRFMTQSRGELGGFPVGDSWIVSARKRKRNE